MKAVVVLFLVSCIGAVGTLPALAADSTCTQVQIKLGTCEIGAENNGDGVTIIGKGEVSTNPGNGGPWLGGPAVPAPAPAPPVVVRDNYTATLIRISDLVKFKPTPGIDHMQPDGWMAVGLDANFYARATQQVKMGDLLGKPASVRFTPVLYNWSYGDGSFRLARTAGATWGALGLGEFDRTATSHVFRSAGTFNIDLTIGFSPEYRYASGTDWIPIAGYVWAPANRLVAVAGGSKTVLVQRDCTIAPSGPGC